MTESNRSTTSSVSRERSRVIDVRVRILAILLGILAMAAALALYMWVLIHDDLYKWIAFALIVIWLAVFITAVRLDNRRD